MTIYGGASRLNFTIPGGGFPTLDQLTLPPAVAAKPLTTGLSAPLFAQWDFGPDSGSLSSMSSGHALTPLAAAGLSYDGVSASNAAANLAGVTIPIADALTAQTWWGVNKVTGAAADGGQWLGNQADDSADATTGWQIFRNSFAAGSIALAARGISAGATIYNAQVAGDNLFWCVALDTGGGLEAYVGGAAASVPIGRAEATFTFSGTGTAGKTITLGSHTLTIGTDFAVGGTAAATATNLANYVNANKGPLGGMYATVSGAVTTVYYILGGAAGNTLVSATNDPAVAVSGANFTGGAARTVTSRLPAMFNAYSTAAFFQHSQTAYELGYVPSVLNAAQMATLYAEVKTRLGQQGVTVK